MEIGRKKENLFCYLTPLWRKRNRLATSEMKKRGVFEPWVSPGFEPVRLSRNGITLRLAIPLTIPVLLKLGTKKIWLEFNHDWKVTKLWSLSDFNGLSFFQANIFCKRWWKICKSHDVTLLKWKIREKLERKGSFFEVGYGGRVTD